MKSLFSIFCMLALTVLTVSGQDADTTIVLNYGPMPIGNITVSKSSSTYRQVKEAEAVVEGLTDQKAKNRAVMSYVLSHPDSEGSVLLLNHLLGFSNARKCLSAISEQARSGLMKPLYDAFADGIKEFDTMAAKTREAIVIGKEAKDFTLEDFSGKMLTLSSLRGKYVLLDFWGSWCGGCIQAFPHIKAFYASHRDKVEVLGVAIHDKKDKWKAAAQEHELPWKLVLDTEGTGSVAEAYGIVAAPTYVLIDPEGKVVEWNIGEMESIEERFDDN